MGQCYGHLLAVVDDTPDQVVVVLTCSIKKGGDVHMLALWPL